MYTSVIRVPSPHDFTMHCYLATALLREHGTIFTGDDVTVQLPTLRDVGTNGTGNQSAGIQHPGDD